MVQAAWFGTFLGHLDAAARAHVHTPSGAGKAGGDATEAWVTLELTDVPASSDLVRTGASSASLLLCVHLTSVAGTGGAHTQLPHGAQAACVVRMPFSMFEDTTMRGNKPSIWSMTKMSVTGERVLLRALVPLLRAAATASKNNMDATAGSGGGESDAFYDAAGSLSTLLLRNSNEAVADGRAIKDVHECLQCSRGFNILFRRRYVCALCRRVLCADCLPHRVDGNVRTCTDCYTNLRAPRVAVATAPAEDTWSAEEGHPLLRSRIASVLEAHAKSKVTVGDKAEEQYAADGCGGGESDGGDAMAVMNAALQQAVLTLTDKVVSLEASQRRFLVLAMLLCAAVATQSMWANTATKMLEMSPFHSPLLRQWLPPDMDVFGSGLLEWSWWTWRRMSAAMALSVVLLFAVRLQVDSLFHRRMVVYLLAFRLIFTYKAVKTYLGYSTWSEAEQNAYWSKLHRKYSALVVSNIMSLLGFWVKVGQYLSSRADVLPDEWLKELGKLQDAMPCSDMDHVSSSFQADFGKTLEDCFLSFDETPIASASIGQVHRARLRPEGRDVVVKIQHPRIKEVMAQDMVNLGKILSWVAYLEPTFDFKPIVDAWAEEAAKELSFNNEADNLERARANAEKANLRVIIPQVERSLVSERILTMSFEAGFKINDLKRLDKYNIDREALVTRIIQAYGSSIFSNQFFNADPHPGNILVTIQDNEAVPVLLDYGLTKALENRLTVGFARMLVSASDLDSGGLVQSFEEMGIVLNRLNPASDMRAMRFIFRESGTRSEANKERKAYRAEYKKEVETLPKSQRNPVDAWPTELIFLFRVVMLLRGLCTSLQVRVPFMKVLAPYARMALLDTVPTALHAVRLIHAGPVLSETERKVRLLIRELDSAGLVTGMQVAVYYRGEKIVDTAAGFLGKIDPRPVAPDTLFNCFSVTKAVAAVAAHQVLEAQGVAPGQKVTELWPAFAGGGGGDDDGDDGGRKDLDEEDRVLLAAKADTTVEQLLSHQAGLESAVPPMTKVEDLIDWDRMLSRMERAVPSTRPGERARYHFLSFGWLVGGLVQHASKDGTHIQEQVRERIARVLDIEEEFYLGGVDEAAVGTGRLAVMENALLDDIGMSREQIAGLLADVESGRPAASLDGPGSPTEQEGADASAMGGLAQRAREAVDAQRKKDKKQQQRNKNNKKGNDGGGGGGGGGGAASALSALDPCIFNLKNVRSGCIPAANGHFTARALARMYASLCHMPNVPPVLGETQVESMTTIVSKEKQAFTDGSKCWGRGVRVYVAHGEEEDENQAAATSASAAVEKAAKSKRRRFGHEGLGGSTALCDPENGVAIAITVNRLALRRTVAAKIVALVTRELGVPMFPALEEEVSL